MKKDRKHLHDANIDIVDWLTNRFSDRDFEPEMLLPAVMKYYRESIERFDGEARKFEPFAVKFITLRISKFKMSDGESMAWSREQMECVLLLDEQEETEVLTLKQ